MIFLHARPKGSPIVFDASILQHATTIPSPFIWPDDEKPMPDPPVLRVPPIDIGEVLSGDPLQVAKAISHVDEACKRHGYFLVVNHGVDPSLLARALELNGIFFRMPLDLKQKGRSFASSFPNRFTSKLPWKETLTFLYSSDSNTLNIDQNYLDFFGDELKEFRAVYQEYCGAMNRLCLDIMELFGMSLGLERSYFRRYFEANDSILRLNYYPPSQKPHLVLGTGPHCDPTTLTILHQDHVSGLEVFVDGKWQSIPPSPGAFVVNVGDTLMALSNGIYKSCVHRAVISKETVRKSVAYFLCPKEDKVVKPPEELLSAAEGEDNGKPRLYPDFTWPMLNGFLNDYRCDVMTLDAFSSWLRNQSS